MEFEWDPLKAEANLKKHGVSFDEASKAFFDENAVEIYDSEHSVNEVRFLLVGIGSSRLLFVAYTVREDVIRIITARKADRGERRYYHEQKR